MESSYYKIMYCDCSAEKEKVANETDNFTKKRGTIFATSKTEKDVYIQCFKTNGYKVNCFKCGFGYMLEFVK